MTRTLPEYELKHIFTGQVVRVENPSGEITWKGPVWEGSYTFGERPASAAERSTSPYPQVNADDPSPGAELFAARCAVCHNLAAAHMGPHLNGVIGRRAGDVAGFNGCPDCAGYRLDKRKWPNSSPIPPSLHREPLWLIWESLLRKPNKSPSFFLRNNDAEYSSSICLICMSDQ